MAPSRAAGTFARCSIGGRWLGNPVRRTMAKDDDLRALVEEYGRALSRCDLPAIAAAWEVPALVLADQGSIAVESTHQIETFFGAATQQYRDQGIVSTTPEIARVEWLSELVAEVRVRWLRWAA